MVALLEDLAAIDVRGTFFVVADLVRQSSGLIRRVASAGHEIASHDLAHVPWDARGRVNVARDLLVSRRMLEDASETPVSGVRAPYFSLTSRTPWAPEVLQEVGFSYSSSVLSAWNPMSGFAAAPRRPFRWAGGVIELPVPLLSVGPLGVPVLGGAYLRYVPWVLARQLLLRPRGQALWTYAHPYDLDTSEPFTRIHDAGLLTSALLWCRRSVMLPRLLRSLQLPSRPLGERVAAGEFEDASPWSGW